MVNHFMSHPQNALDKDQMVNEKDATIYSAAMNYDPNRKTKFSTHLANQTKWKCLNLLNKNKRMKQFFIDEDENHFEPSCESFIADLTRGEVLSVFETCLKKE